jgi:hypothetical protein
LSAYAAGNEHIYWHSLGVAERLLFSRTEGHTPSENRIGSQLRASAATGCSVPAPPAQWYLKSSGTTAATIR